MSFFDEYKDIGGGEYVSSDEKNVLAENGIPFKITDVAYQEESKFGERYVCRVLLPDPETGDEEERLMSFAAGGMVESRDRMFKAMIEYLDDADAEPPLVKVEKVGRSFILRAAEPVETPKPKPASRSRAKK